jgi:D-alanine-D-alanine ligase
MLRLALIFGGRSAEHEISLASARFVHSMLDRDRYEVIPVGITPAGRWVTPDDFDEAVTVGLDAAASRPAHLVSDPGRPGLELADGSFHPLDFAFPIMHGTFAEDGTIQGLLEMAGLAYAGSGVLGSSVGMDKELMKAVFANAGLPQMEYLVLRDAAASGPDAVAAVEARLDYPVFVKPANLGSSVGMTKAHDRGELGPALELASVYDRKTIVEAACDGRELECALLGNDDVRASVVGEVIPGNEFYDYESKYTEGKMAFTIPADVDARHSDRVRELAAAAFRAIDANGFSRCDFFLETVTDRVILNEINTIPGMTAMSGFPRLWAASAWMAGRWSRRSCGWGSSATSGSPGSRWRADGSYRPPGRYSALPVRVGCGVRSTQSASGGIFPRYVNTYVSAVAVAVTVNFTVPLAVCAALKLVISMSDLARYCSAASLAAVTSVVWAYSVSASSAADAASSADW